jgi:hypothetical protein
MEKMRNEYKVLVGESVGKRPLKKQNVRAWIGLISLSTETSGGYL